MRARATAVLFCLTIILGLESRAAATLTVMGLQTESLTQPIGIDMPRPRFRWRLQSVARAQRQSAYQLLVASSLERLQADIGDQWDSGKVDSDNSVEISYQGRTLHSAERLYWKVRIWNEAGLVSGYSAPTSFETGLLNRSDWQSQWIAAVLPKAGASPLFRREFILDAPIRSARAYVSGLGFYELSINGKKVGDRVLDPAQTAYSVKPSSQLGSRVSYSIYDVTEALQRGANAVGLVLGNGWYSPQPTVDRSFLVPYADRPCVILQIVIELTNGRTITVISDDSWKTASGPITYNDLVEGETYDARLEQGDWSLPGFNDAAWQKASLADPPTGMLTAALLPPAKVTDTLPVARVISPKEPSVVHDDNTILYDFGQNFSGWVRVSVSGPRGSKLVLRYATRLHADDDTLDTRSNELPSVAAHPSDTYILKGEGTEIWEPRFTLHGFRYVEVQSFAGRPSILEIEGRVVNSNLDSTGTFDSDNPLLDRIHRNIQWTLRSSLQGVPHDAAERNERVGWMGDVSYVTEDYVDNYDMLKFWEKWLNDIKDSQRPDGSVALVSPLNFKVADYQLWPCWDNTYPLLVWQLYQSYGDRRVIEDHYLSLKKLLDITSKLARGDIIAVGLGDHMEPQENGFSHFFPLHTPTALTSTACYYQDVRLLAQMAGTLGRTEDVKVFDKRANDIKASFNRTFFNAGTNQYATGSQTSNALALQLQLVPPEKIAAVMKNLTSDIIEHHTGHVSTGIIGSNALVQVLPLYGAAPLMYLLANQTTYPSLGDQVMKGATTVCETYECGALQGQNMKMFSSLDKFFFRNLGGIQLTAAGYRRILIKPLPLGDLHHVTVEQQSVRGPIRVEWRRTDSTFALSVDIPGGIDADIAIPTLGLATVTVAEGENTVWRSNAYVSGTPGLTGAKLNPDSISFYAGSGSYHFVLNGAGY